MKIILASGSPRRKEILEQIGLDFTIRPAKGEEIIRSQEPPEIVSELSRQKAEEIAGEAEEESLIIGADTIVAFEGRILGKPSDEEGAVSMLKLLEGQTHQVYTGVTLIIKSKINKITTFVEQTDVKICSMTEEEIRSYAATGEPLDKAGAYAVQGLFARYVEGLQGDFYNVMGLPVHRLCREAEKLGVRL